MYSIPFALDRDLQEWGDSLTESSSGGITEDQRWPYTLAASFTPARVSDNRGVGGESAAQIRARMEAAAVPNYQIVTMPATDCTSAPMGSPWCALQSTLESPPAAGDPHPCR